MDIKTLEGLGLIADLCRKKGIESIKITDTAVEFKLAEKETPRRRRRKDNTPEIQSSSGDELYGEDAALFWSAALPGEGN